MKYNGAQTSLMMMTQTQDDCFYMHLLKHLVAVFVQKRTLVSGGPLIWPPTMAYI